MRVGEESYQRSKLLKAETAHTYQLVKKPTPNKSRSFAFTSVKSFAAAGIVRAFSVAALAVIE